MGIKHLCWSNDWNTRLIFEYDTVLLPWNYAGLLSVYDCVSVLGGILISLDQNIIMLIALWWTLPNSLGDLFFENDIVHVEYTICVFRQ